PQQLHYAHKRNAIMKTETNSLHTKLAYCAVALAAIKIKVNKAGQFGEDYEAARDTLFEAFAIFGEVGVLSEPPLSKKAQTICERDGATLHVWGTDMIHTSSSGEETKVNDDDEMAGALGSIVVGGHEWRWGEMADGVIA